MGFGWGNQSLKPIILHVHVLYVRTGPKQVFPRVVDQFKVGNYYGYCDVGYLVNCCFTVYARASKFANTDQEISLELLTPSMVIVLSACKLV